MSFSASKRAHLNFWLNHFTSELTNATGANASTGEKQAAARAIPYNITFMDTIQHNLHGGIARDAANCCVCEFATIDADANAFFFMHQPSFDP